MGYWETGEIWNSEKPGLRETPWFIAPAVCLGQISYLL